VSLAFHDDVECAVVLVPAHFALRHDGLHRPDRSRIGCRAAGATARARRRVHSVCRAR
jgi:hypothetical protein